MKLSEHYKLANEIRDKNKNGYSIEDLKTEYPPDLIDYLKKVRLIK